MQPNSQHFPACKGAQKVVDQLCGQRSWVFQTRQLPSKPQEGMYGPLICLCYALLLSEATAFYREPPTPWKSLSCSPDTGKWGLSLLGEPLSLSLLLRVWTSLFRIQGMSDHLPWVQGLPFRCSLWCSYRLLPKADDRESKYTVPLKGLHQPPEESGLSFGLLLEKPSPSNDWAIQSWIIWPVGVGRLLDRKLVVRSRRSESERRKEANIPWVMQPAFVLQGISQK